MTGPFAEMYLDFTPGLEEAGGWNIHESKAVLLGEKGAAKVSLTTMKEYVFPFPFPFPFYCLELHFI